MKFFLHSSLGHSNVSRIGTSVLSVLNHHPVYSLGNFSIPSTLRKTIFRNAKLPLFWGDICQKSTGLMPLSITCSLQIYTCQQKFIIFLRHNDFQLLPVALSSLIQANPLFPIYLYCDFIVQDTRFLEEMKRQFSDTKIYFYFSQLEYSYFQIEDIHKNTAYIKSDCLEERLQMGLQDFDTEKTHYYQNDISHIVPYIGFSRYYTVRHKNYGIVKENFLLPNSVNKDDIIILS